MLGRALKMAFWVLYDHLGKLVLVNLLWSLAMALPGWLALNAVFSEDPRIRLLVGAPLSLVTLGVIAPVGAAGIAYLAKVLIETRDGAVADFWTGIRRFWGRATAIGLLFSIIACSLGTSVWFYAQTLSKSLSWLGYGLSGLAAWCLIFEGLTSLLVIPALVQKNGGVRETVKLAGLLVLDNPFFTAGLASQVLAFSALLIIPPVFFLIYGAAVVVLMTAAYEMLARKYAAIELQQATETQGVSAKAGSVRAALLVDDSQDDYLNRGIRDFLFPWKG